MFDVSENILKIMYQRKILIKKWETINYNCKSGQVQVGRVYVRKGRLFLIN